MSFVSVPKLSSLVCAILLLTLLLFSYSCFNGLKHSDEKESSFSEKVTTPADFQTSICPGTYKGLAFPARRLLEYLRNDQLAKVEIIPFRDGDGKMKLYAKPLDIDDRPLADLTPFLIKEDRLDHDERIREPSSRCQMVITNKLLRHLADEFTSEDVIALKPLMIESELSAGRFTMTYKIYKGDLDERNSTSLFLNPSPPATLQIKNKKAKSSN